MSDKKSIHARMERIARRKFGYESLYPAQRDAIEAVVAGRDTLVIMPTGSGKSAIYQIAGLMLQGPTIIISPLLALQRDQVQSLEEEGVEAAALNSSEPQSERDEALSELEEDEVEFLFMAPEQFAREETLQLIKDAGPSLFVVDEAHCISEWGTTFRPDYLRLGAVIEALGHPTVLALTATASEPTRREIVERLGMRDPQVLVTGFDRPNIWLGVEHYHDETVKRRALVDRVAETDGSGIVYAATRKHAEEVAAALSEVGVAALVYHAGVPAGERRDAEQRFLDDEIRVMVATNAFGMGIDKPNVRFVFHHDIPESVDAYYQQIGRAGRDGEPATTILYYRPQDLALHRFFGGTGKVGPEELEQIAAALDCEEGSVDDVELQEDTGLSAAKVHTALTRLEEVGAIDILPTGEVVEIERVERPEVIAEAADEEKRRREADNSRLEMMRGYAELQDCRRTYLLNYFGEQPREPRCGRCDNCEAGITGGPDLAAQPFPLNARVAHGSFGEGTVQRYEGDKMVVLFDGVGYKELLTDFVTQSGALTAAEVT